MGKASNIDETNQIAKLKSEKTRLKKQIEELEEKCEQLQANQTKLISDLESLKTTDADLVNSQQELRECDKGLEVEMKKNLQCQSDNKSIKNELEELTWTCPSLANRFAILMLSTRKSTNVPTLIGLDGKTSSAAFFSGSLETEFLYRLNKKIDDTSILIHFAFRKCATRIGLNDRGRRKFVFGMWCSIE